MAEREVPHPRSVGDDAVADLPREHERAHRRRREHRVRHQLGRRRTRRIRELERVRASPMHVLADVRGEDDDFDRCVRELARDLRQVAEPLVHRRRQLVFVRAEQRQPPQRVRPERVLGLEAEHELLELVEAVERGHHAGDRARRRAVDPADARPEVGLAQPLEEAELHQEPVDGSPGENDCDVAFHASQITTRDPPMRRCRPMPRRSGSTSRR